MKIIKVIEEKRINVESTDEMKGFRETVRELRRQGANVKYEVTLSDGRVIKSRNYPA